MAKWRKRFAAWETARQPVPVDEVESILYRVFGDRVREIEGTSHRWVVSVPELMQVDRDFEYGEICVPIRGGKRVLGSYCQQLFRAAQWLELPLAVEENENEEDDVS